MSDEQRMVLRTEDLVKKYRTRTVVNHVSINVKQGEIVGLLGPNGAGKTTTFYMTVGWRLRNSRSISGLATALAIWRKRLRFSGK